MQCNSLTSNAENHQRDASLHLDPAQTTAHEERRTGQSLCAGQELLTLPAKGAASLHCSLKQHEFNERKEACPYCWKNEYSGREMERCFVNRLVFSLVWFWWRLPTSSFARQLHKIKEQWKEGKHKSITWKEKQKKKEFKLYKYMKNSLNFWRPKKPDLQLI